MNQIKKNKDVFRSSGGSSLSVKNLNAEYYSGGNTVAALRGVDLRLEEGECIGVAGESGSGKSTLALSVLKLIDDAEGRVFGKSVNFKNKSENINLLSLNKKDIQKVRGKIISLITQDPYTSFNPVIKLRDQFREIYRIHNPRKSESSFKKRVFEMLDSVDLKPARKVLDLYPHQLSGGMLQRASMAAALLNGPRLLIADEPTSSLDVTIQKTVIDKLKELRSLFKLSIIFISHDLNLISGIADRVYILYSGKVMEHAPAEEIFKNPAHPYTAALLKAIPDMRGKRKISPIPGVPPRPGVIKKGCTFAPRCSFVKRECLKREPSLVERSRGEVACINKL